MQQPASTEATPARRRRIRKPRLLALLLVLFALASASFTFGLVSAIAGEIETLDPSNRRGDVDTVVYAAPSPSGDRRVLASLRGEESRVLVPSEEIADVMKQAIVAVDLAALRHDRAAIGRGAFSCRRKCVRTHREGRQQSGFAWRT